MWELREGVVVVVVHSVMSSFFFSLSLSCLDIASSYLVLDVKVVTEHHWWGRTALTRNGHGTLCKRSHFFKRNDAVARGMLSFVWNRVLLLCKLQHDEDVCRHNETQVVQRLIGMQLTRLRQKTPNIHQPFTWWTLQWQEENKIFTTSFSPINTICFLYPWQW